VKAIKFPARRVVAKDATTYIATFDQHLTAEYVHDLTVEKFTFEELTDSDIHILKYGDFEELLNLLNVSVITSRF
jgi:hypothetical protein